MVFDFYWITRDKKGNVIDSASYIMLDVIATERPYFIHKVKGYISKARKESFKQIFLLLEDYSIKHIEKNRIKIIGLFFVLKMVVLIVMHLLKLQKE